MSLLAFSPKVVNGCKYRKFTTGFGRIWHVPLAVYVRCLGRDVERTKKWTSDEIWRLIKLGKTNSILFLLILKKKVTVMNLGNSWKSYLKTTDSSSSLSQHKVECCSLGFLAYLEIGVGLRKTQRWSALLQAPPASHLSRRSIINGPQTPLTARDFNYLLAICNGFCSRKTAFFRTSLIQAFKQQCLILGVTSISLHVGPNLSVLEQVTALSLVLCVPLNTIGAEWVGSSAVI